MSSLLDGGSARFTMSGGRPQPLTTGVVSGGSTGEIANALKDLKQNYEQLENNIVENTKKQRLDQIAKHKQVLTQLEALRKFLKSEVATRKETELHFERVIDQRVEEITEHFTVTYLNQLYELRNKVKEFGERQ